MPEHPPRLAWEMWKRFLLGSVIVVVLTAASVATAGLLEIDSVVDRFQEHVETFKVPELTRAEAGEPQTILLLGSDLRYADKQAGLKARSDTIVLLRLDPDADVTSVLTIPRDLKVTMRRGENGTGGVIEDKINAAYALGGPRLTTRVVRELMTVPGGKDFEINHIVNVDFGGFRRAINRLNCVYVDVDRRYFNDNSGPGPNYATIDIKEGYQKLCGQDALDFVRYRHTDTDFVRGARQQEFLRQVKAQVSTGRLISDREKLVEIFAKHTETDDQLKQQNQILQLLKLAIFTRNNRVHAVRWRGTPGETYVTSTPDEIRKTVEEFLSGKAGSGPRGPRPKATDAEKREARRKRRNRKPEVAPGLVAAKTQGEDQAALADPKLPFPVYFPTLRTTYASYYPEPRTYDLYDRGKRKRRAYRIVAKAGLVGEYYGIQGTNWMNPPILEGNYEKREMRGRTYRLYYDGGRLRMVAWKTKKATYWVSNTLLLTIGNRQMLGIARSLTRLGG